MRGLISLLVASVLILCVIVPRLAREPLPPASPGSPSPDPRLSIGLSPHDLKVTE